MDAGVQHVLVGLGALGVLHVTKPPRGGATHHATRYHALPKRTQGGNNNGAGTCVCGLPSLISSSTTSIVWFGMSDSVGGAVRAVGDSLCAGVVYGLHRGLSVEEAIRCGLQVARLCIECDEPVNPALAPEQITLPPAAKL